MKHSLILLSAPPPLGKCPAGSQAVSCAALLRLTQGATTWVLVALGCAALVWVIASFYQVTSLTGPRRGAWRLLAERLLICGLVFFLTAHLGDFMTMLLQLIAENRLSGITDQGPFGLPMWPFTVLLGEGFALLLQGALGWIMIGIALECLAGLFALQGYGRRALGETLAKLGELACFGIALGFVPRVVSWLFHLQQIPLPGSF